MQSILSRFVAEVCPLCGISRNGGPCSVLQRMDRDSAAHAIAQEILSASTTSSTPLDATGDIDAGLTDVVKEMLSTTISRQTLRPEWMPDGVGCESTVTLTSPKHYLTWRWIAVGYFQEGSGVGGDDELDSDDDCAGYAPVRDNGVDNFPDGRNVQVRTVTDDNPLCRTMDFCQVVVRPTTDTIAGDTQEQIIDLSSICTARPYLNPNIAMCERCYYYLKHWLDTAGLPPPLISFPGELYEIVNSQLELRERRGLCLT